MFRAALFILSKSFFVKQLKCIFITEYVRKLLHICTIECYPAINWIELLTTHKHLIESQKHYDMSKKFLSQKVVYCMISFK